MGTRPIYRITRTYISLNSSISSTQNNCISFQLGTREYRHSPSKKKKKKLSKCNRHLRSVYCVGKHVPNRKLRRLKAVWLGLIGCYVRNGFWTRADVAALIVPESMTYINNPCSIWHTEKGTAGSKIIFALYSAPLRRALTQNAS